MLSKRTLQSLILLAILVASCGGAATPTQAPAATEPPVATDVPSVTTAPDPTAAPAATSEPVANAACKKVGGQLVVFASSDPKSLDPAILSSYDQTLTAPNFVEGLFRLSPDGTSIEPGIAESYEVSEDGLTWTFSLRGAKFHDGTPVTAADFKYSFERVLNPATQSPKAWMLEKVVGAAEYRSGSASEVSGIAVVDDHTLTLTLTEALAPFKSMLASPNLAVVPQAAVEKWGADFGQHLVAAGPFKLGTWNLNQDVTGDAFLDYWNGRPCVDSVKWRMIGDENTRVVEYDAQQLDITWVPPANWDRFNGSEDTKALLNWAHTFHTEFWAVNLESEPFGTNPLLRQAICHAFDRDAIVASLQGRATPGEGILSPGLLGFNEKAVPCVHDVEQAKALMAEAGYPDGVPGTFDILMPNWGNLIKLNEIYQANLKEIGINVDLKPTEFGPYLELLNKGDYDLAWIYRVPDYADPDGFYFPLLASQNIDGGGNVARYNNTEVDELIAKGRVSLDDAQRTEYYQAIEAIVAQDLPYIPLMHNIYVDIRQPYVENYVPSPMDMHMYEFVWLNK